MSSAKKSKDETNLEAVLAKIADMPPPIREVCERVHEVITTAAPDLKPRIWYGMPGYATSASSPVIAFFRHDELFTLGLTEKAALTLGSKADGMLSPCAWYFEAIDEATEKRIAEIITSALWRGIASCAGVSGTSQLADSDQEMLETGSPVRVAKAAAASTRSLNSC